MHLEIEGRVPFLLDVGGRCAAETGSMSLKAVLILVVGLFACSTPSFSGADLSNVLNEAAILAARRQNATIDAGDVEEARPATLAFFGPMRMADCRPRNPEFSASIEA